MRANDTRRNASNKKSWMTTRTTDTINVAFNPATRRYEEVYPESEMAGEQIIAMYWCQSAERYVTVPED